MERSPSRLTNWCSTIGHRTEMNDVTWEGAITDEHVPHDDYAAGFRAGWQAVHGNAKPLPLIPLEPRITASGWTRFTTGIRVAVEMGLGVEELDELRR